MQDVVFFKVNCEKGDGPAIAGKYEVHAYPTYLALNGRGEVTDRWVGYGGPEAWSATAEAAAADPRTIVQKRAAFEAEPNATLAVALANHAAGSNDFPGAVGYLRQARERDPANAADYGDQILSDMYYGARGGAFTFAEVEAEAKLALAADDITVREQMDLTMMLRELAGRTDQPEKGIPYLMAALKASEGSTDEYVLAGREQLEIDHALLVEKDPDKALGLYRRTFDEGWRDDAGKLNQFAWWCFQNDVNLEEAQTLALKGVELAEDDGMRANILDTAAEICNRLGNCDEAVAHMKRAVALAPDKQYFQDQLDRFEKVLTEKNDG